MKVKYIPIVVRCPFDPKILQHMTIEIVDFEDGTQMNRYCLGCDSANGSANCEKCKANITEFFFHHLDARPDNPLDPFSDGFLSPVP